MAERTGGEAMTWVVAIIAGGMGAVARWVLSNGRPARTAAMNVAGSAALGVMVGLEATGSGAFLVVAGGFFGGFTTFSTWMVEAGVAGAEEQALTTAVLVPAAAGWLAVVAGRAAVGLI